MKGESLYTGHRFRRSIRHFLMGRATQAVAHFVLMLWLVRLLAPGDYGTYMIMWGVVEMMAPLTSLGMLEAVRRYVPNLAARGAPGALARFVRTMTLIRLGLMLAWALLIAYFWSGIAGWLGLNVAQQDAALVAIGLVVSVIGFRYASEMLECLLEQRWSQLVYALMPIGRLLGVAALVAMDSMSLANVFWVDIAVSISCFLLAELFLAHRLKALTGAGDNRADLRDVAGFAWHMAGSNLLEASAGHGALRLLIARLLGVEAAGLFAFLQQLLLIVGRYLPANLLANMVRPMLIARHSAGDNAVVSQGMALMWKTNILIILTCVAAFVVGGDAVIALASGGRFQGAGMVILLLFLGLGASVQQQLASMAMQIHNRARDLRNLSVLALLVPGAVWVGSSHGLLGSALGIAVAQWFICSISLWWMQRQGISFSPDWVGVARVLGAMAAVAFVAVFAASWTGEWLALGFVLLMFPLSILVVKPLVGSDVDLLRRGLHSDTRFLVPFCRSC